MKKTALAAMLTAMALPMAAMGSVTGPRIALPAVGTVQFRNNNDVVYNPATGGYFIVWTQGNVADHDVMGAMISPDGDLGPTLTFDTLRDCVMPSVAWNPSTSQFLIVYSRTEGGGPAQVTPFNYEVMGLIVDSAGRPVGGATPFYMDAISAGEINDALPRAACDGTNWVVAWQSAHIFEGTSAIRARMVIGRTSTNAMPAFPTAAFTIENFTTPASPAIAFGAFAGASTPTYLVVWQDNSAGLHGIFGRTLDVMLAVGGVRARYDGGGETFTRESPALCANAAGSEFLVGWTDNSMAGELRGRAMIRRIGATGAPLGSAIGADSDPAADQLFVTVGWNTAMSQYVVAWYDDEGSVNGAGQYMINSRPFDTLLAPTAETSPVVATPFFVNTTAGSREMTVSSMASRGNSRDMILAWRQDVGGGGPFPLQAQRFTLDGVAPIEGGNGEPGGGTSGEDSGHGSTSGGCGSSATGPGSILLALAILAPAVLRR